VNTTSEITPAPEQNFTVFVSHPTEDKFIAQALQDALVDLDRLRVDVFVDQTAIPKGKPIGSYITASLDRANWFIAIGADAVRSNFSWCGMELGYFLGVQPKNPGRSLTLIYHAQIHELFAEQNNTKVVPLEAAHAAELPGEIVDVKKCQLFTLFMDIAQSYVDFYSRGIQQRQPIDLGDKFHDWAESSARSVTKSYYEALRERVKDVWYPQNRLEIRIEDGDFWNNPTGAIPADSKVELDIPTYALFRLAAPAGQPRSPITWQDFGEIIRRQCGGDALLKIIDEVLCSVLPLGADAENDYTFIAPNRLRYRVLLVKHQRYGTNRREFVINFVPTIKRDAGGNEATTQLTAVIMMASKYWFMFLESESNYSLEAFRRAEPLGTFASLARKMLRDMDRVVLEANDDGLTNKDVLDDLLGRSDELSDMRNIWWPAMDRLRAAANSVVRADDKNRDDFMSALADFTELSRTLNRDFIRLCLDSYKLRLEQNSTEPVISLTTQIKEPVVTLDASS
jgi:hypothetical protein